MNEPVAPAELDEVPDGGVRDDQTEGETRGTALSLAETALVTGRHRSTLRRYLGAERFPNAYRGAGGAWQIPITDLLSAGLFLHADRPTRRSLSLGSRPRSSACGWRTPNFAAASPWPRPSPTNAPSGSRIFGCLFGCCSRRTRPETAKRPSRLSALSFGRARSPRTTRTNRRAFGCTRSGLPRRQTRPRCRRDAEPGVSAPCLASGRAVSPRCALFRTPFHPITRPADGSAMLPATHVSLTVGSTAR